MDGFGVPVSHIIHLPQFGQLTYSPSPIYWITPNNVWDAQSTDHRHNTATHPPAILQYLLPNHFHLICIPPAAIGMPINCSSLWEPAITPSAPLVLGIVVIKWINWTAMWRAIIQTASTGELQSPRLWCSSAKLSAICSDGCPWSWHIVDGRKGRKKWRVSCVCDRCLIKWPTLPFRTCTDVVKDTCGPTEQV